MKRLLIFCLLFFEFTGLYSQRLRLYDKDSDKNLTSFKKGQTIRLVLYENKPLQLDFNKIDSICKIDYADKKDFEKILLDTLDSPILYFSTKISGFSNDSIEISSLSLYDKTKDIRLDKNYFYHFNDIYLTKSYTPKLDYNDIQIIYKPQDWRLTTTALIMAGAFVTGVLSPLIAYDFKDKHFNTGKFLGVAGIGFGIYLGGGYVMTHLQNNIGYYTTDYNIKKELSRQYKYTDLKIE